MSWDGLVEAYDAVRAVATRRRLVFGPAWRKRRCGCRRPHRYVGHGEKATGEISESIRTFHCRRSCRGLVLRLVDPKTGRCQARLNRRRVRRSLCLELSPTPPAHADFPTTLSLSYWRQPPQHPPPNYQSRVQSCRGDTIPGYDRVNTR